MVVVAAVALALDLDSEWPKGSLMLGIGGVLLTFLYWAGSGNVTPGNSGTTDETFDVRAGLP